MTSPFQLRAAREQGEQPVATYRLQDGRYMTLHKISSPSASRRGSTSGAMSLATKTPPPKLRQSRGSTPSEPATPRSSVSTARGTPSKLGARRTENRNGPRKLPRRDSFAGVTTPLKARKSEDTVTPKRKAPAKLGPRKDSTTSERRRSSVAPAKLPLRQAPAKVKQSSEESGSGNARPKPRKLLAREKNVAPAQPDEKNFDPFMARRVPRKLEKGDEKQNETSAPLDQDPDPKATAEDQLSIKRAAGKKTPSSRPRSIKSASSRRVSFQDDTLDPDAQGSKEKKEGREEQEGAMPSVSEESPPKSKILEESSPKLTTKGKPRRRPKKLSLRPKPVREDKAIDNDQVIAGIDPRLTDIDAHNAEQNGGKQGPEDQQQQTRERAQDEENHRDLKSFLSEEQRGDLTLLLADITRQMRWDIEAHFDPSRGLTLLQTDPPNLDKNEGVENKGRKGEKKDDDTTMKALTNMDFDPGTVDVEAYEKERKMRDEQTKELARPETLKLQASHLAWFDEWREGVLLRVGEAVNRKSVVAEQGRDAQPELDVGVAESGSKQRRTQQQIRTIHASDQSADSKSSSKDALKTDNTQGPKLDHLFPRAKTPLTKLPLQKRSLILHSILLLLLSLEHYNAASRVLLLYLTTSLKLGLGSLRRDEERTAQGLLQAAKQMTADDEAQQRLAQGNDSATRKWKIRLASVAGAAVVGYTGGLAAPMIAAGVGSIMSELGLGATVAAGYLGTVASNATVVGGLFGAYGARMTGQVMENISAGVRDFAFLPIHGEREAHDEQSVGESVGAATSFRRLRVIIAISGWLLEKEEVVTPWRVLKPTAETFALRFELEALLNLGQSFDTMVQSAVYGYAQSTAMKQTVLGELMGGMMWPLALTRVARVIDNPFSLARTRADKAGHVLADALMNRVQGERPVTLIAYSLGARVIYSCLTSLAKRRAFGLVESVVLMGAPVPSDTKTWRLMRSAVSGRLVNVYSQNDYLLAFLYRSSSLQYGVAGLMPIAALAGVENVDVTEAVSGHLRYRYLVGSILQKIKFEDIDPKQVAEEAQAYQAMLEEEKQRTYMQQAGDLYESYRGKKPRYKSKKKKDLSESDAEKEASAMEKTRDEKTQNSLTQWAKEQLYLNKPKKGEEKAKANQDPPKHLADMTYYDWAKEGASYLSRSGEKKRNRKAEEEKGNGEEDGEEKVEEQQKQSSGLRSYIPGFGASNKTDVRGKNKKNDDDDDNKNQESGQGDEEEQEKSGYTSYLPSFGLSPKNSKKRKPKDKIKPKDAKREDEEARNAKEGKEDAFPKTPSNVSADEATPSLTRETSNNQMTTDTEPDGEQARGSEDDDDEDDLFTTPPKAGGGNGLFADAKGDDDGSR